MTETLEPLNQENDEDLSWLEDLLAELNNAEDRE